MNWIRINHGGEPTKNKDKKRAIFIGRYQPYHYGHIKLIEQKLLSGTPILILVRDIEPDSSNPFTAKETAEMIMKYHTMKGQDVLTMIIPDIESVNYGRGVGYQINEYQPTEEISNISATYIRKSINDKNDDWKKLVPEEIHSNIISLIRQLKLTTKNNIINK